MKAVLIGTRVYKDKFQDTDLISDDEFVDFISKTLSLTEVVQKELSTTYVFKNDEIVEICVPKSQTAYYQVLNLEFEKGEPLTLFNYSIRKARLSTLAALKKAHLIIPHKWEHHIAEYQTIKNLLGIEIFEPQLWEDAQNIFSTHRKEVKAFAKAHPKLNVNKYNFFEEAEFKIFDHDTIHQAIALGNIPAYTLMQEGEVWCSKKKWDLLTEEEKLRCTIEEACVLALERSIIPALFLGKAFRGAKWAYEFALGKICTTITSGFFRDYSIENYQRAVEARPDFVAKFFDGVKNKTVKVLKPEVVNGSAISV